MATNDSEYGSDHTILHLKDYAPLARMGANMVAEDLKVASTFNRDMEGEFGGKRGQTVNIKLPSALIAHSRDPFSTSALEVDQIVQDTYPVTLNGFAHSTVELSEGDLHYGIEDFASEVLQPQTESVADFVENESIKALRGLPGATESGELLEGSSIEYDAANPDAFFVKARKALIDNGLPASGLWAAVGTQVYADLLQSDVLMDFSQSNSTQALRDAQTGRVRGFNVVEAPMLDETEVVFYGRNSFTLVVRAPKVPVGASHGASVSAGGFAARYVRDYGSANMVDRSSVASFVQVENIPVHKIVRDYDAGEATVEKLPSALRFPDVTDLGAA